MSKVEVTKNFGAKVLYVCVWGGGELKEVYYVAHVALG